MRSPRAYLAVSFACAAVVLMTLSALACPGAAETMPTPAGIRTPVPNTESCLPLINGQPVWPGSPQCQPATSHFSVPTADRLGAIRWFTVRVIESDISSGALIVSVPYAQVLADARGLVPKFVDRAIYDRYVLPPGWEPTCGLDWCGCAAGVGSWPPVVDASQPRDRVEKLVSHELTNAVLGKLSRADLWDGTYTSSVVTRVGQQLGGWAKD